MVDIPGWKIERIIPDEKPKTLKELFDAPRLKVERAKRHIIDYRAAHKTFTESEPIKFTPELDPQTGDVIHKFIFDNPKTGEMQVCAADSLYNLRSALDQAVSCCSRIAGESAKETYFPHGLDKTGFEVSLREKCKKVPEPVRDAITALEPYYGGSGYLFRAIHDLNLVDKHTDLLAVAAALREITVETNVPFKEMPPGSVVWKRSKNKFDITNTPDETVAQNIKITFAITFTDVEAVKGQSVTKVLTEAADLVSRTIDILETTMIEWKAANS